MKGQGPVTTRLRLWSPWWPVGLFTDPSICLDNFVWRLGQLDFCFPLWCPRPFGTLFSFERRNSFWTRHLQVSKLVKMCLSLNCLIISSELCVRVPVGEIFAGLKSQGWDCGFNGDNTKGLQLQGTQRIGLESQSIGFQCLLIFVYVWLFYLLKLAVWGLSFSVIVTNPL